MAANSAMVDYSIEDLEPPILSIEDAVAKSSFSDVPPFLCPNQVGDVSKGMAKANHKILSAEVEAWIMFSLVPLFPIFHSFRIFVAIYLGS